METAEELGPGMGWKSSVCHGCATLQKTRGGGNGERETRRGERNVKGGRVGRKRKQMKVICGLFN